MMLYKFTIDKESLKKEFYSEEWSPQREWFFHQYKGNKRSMIQNDFYKFLDKVKLNIPFFDWFHAYTIKNNVDYPFQTDLIGDRTTNVISSWHLRDDKTIHSEFPPDAPFKLKSKSDNPVLASPFKTKLESEPINSTDIKNLIEQSNYTNKYLQALGKNLGTNSSNQASTSSSTLIEKPLFKPFKLSKQIKKELHDSNPKLKLKEEAKNELLDMVNKQLKLYHTTIPDSPQTPQSSFTKGLNMIQSQSYSDKDENFEMNINPVITGPKVNWKNQTKLYYPRATAPASF